MLAHACADQPLFGNNPAVRYVVVWLEMLTFLLGVAVLLSAPLLLVIFALRRWIPRTAARALLASSFAAAVAYQIWRMEWFDVWRHGFPGTSYLLTAFAPYMLVFGWLGWCVGGLVYRRTPWPRQGQWPLDAE
jgi:hypothetical protein